MMTKKRYSERRKQAAHRSRGVSILLFVVVLTAGGILGLMFPLRPEVSEAENRTLSEFPAFSLTGIMNGSYFSAVSEWYSDSYPFRDVWIKGNDEMERMKGIQTVQIIGGGKKGDEIPDIPMTAPAASEESGSTREETIAEGKPETSVSEERETALSEESEIALTEEPEIALTEETETAAAEQSGQEVPEETQPPIMGQAINGLFTMGDTAFEIYYFNRAAADTYIETVNRAAASLAGQTQVYDMLIPISSAYYVDQTTHDNLGASSEADAIAYYYGSMSSCVITVPVYEALWNHVSEYIFFRTDHHWNGLGAYYAYRTWAETKGITPHETEEYQKMEFPGFLGSFYNTCRSSAMEANPDTVWAYVPVTYNRMTYTRRDGQSIEWNIVNDVSTYTAGNKYSCFAGGDNPISVISNPNVNNGQTCLVVKESFGNALIPFLTDHYQTIYWIDYRYYNGSITDFAREHQVNDLIFANGIEVIADITNMERLSGLVP